MDRQRNSNSEGVQTVVAIHQPNFLPWLGWFDKLRRADKFIILDDVQFPKSGAGTWINRVRMIIGGRPAWVTLPVVRTFEGTRLISEMLLDEQTNWRSKLLRTLRLNYGKHPYSSDVFEALQPLLESSESSLCQYNVALLEEIATRLGLSWSKVARSSATPVAERSTDRLAALVLSNQGTVYLTGGGATGYQEDDTFLRQGIVTQYQSFVPAAYPQRGTEEFCPGLSVLDALMNLGFGGTRELLLRPPSYPTDTKLFTT
jgi:hypothetical protein